MHCPKSLSLTTHNALPEKLKLKKSICFGSKTHVQYLEELAKCTLVKELVRACCPSYTNVLVYEVVRQCLMSITHNCTSLQGCATMLDGYQMFKC